LFATPNSQTAYLYPLKFTRLLAELPTLSSRSTLTAALLPNHDFPVDEQTATGDPESVWWVEWRQPSVVNTYQTGSLGVRLQQNHQ
jgi:hypothetical protein